MEISRKTRNWVLVLAVILSVVAFRVTTGRPGEPAVYFEGPKPMVIAHRGGSGLRPGNTLMAFEHAAGLGVDGLEMDVRMSADGEPVIIHDADVERTTQGSGAVSDLTLAQLQSLDAAYHWPYDSVPTYRGMGVRIPTLADVLKRFPETRLNLELKAPGPTTAVAVCTALVRWRAQQRVLVTSFDGDTLEAFREACPDAATSATQGEVMRFYIYQWMRLERLYQPTAQALQIPPAARGISLVDQRLLNAAGSRGMHVDIWTINEREDMRKLVAMGVGGIITDYPDVLLDLLGRARLDHPAPMP